jgi:hypothetical protein
MRKASMTHWFEFGCIKAVQFLHEWRNFGADSWMVTQKTLKHYVFSLASAELVAQSTRAFLIRL